MLNKSVITWTAKQLVKMNDGGKFSFDNPVQRSYVWEAKRKSEFIDSMIKGYPTTAFYARRTDGKVYDFLDGKQRLTTIITYFHDEWALTGLAPIDVDDEDGNTTYIDINGKKFSELPEEFQDSIKDYPFTIYYFDDITSEQVRILFKKLNNGKPLSTKERNIANCVDIDTVTDIGKHTLFTKIMTEKSLEARKHLPIIMKIYMMITQPIINVSFESKDFNEVISNCYISDEEKENIINVLDKAEGVYDILEANKDKARKKFATETNLVSMTPFLLRGYEEDISDNLIADFVSDTFGGDVVVSETYEEATSKGSAKGSSITTRNNELEEAWENFFEVDEG